MILEHSCISPLRVGRCCPRSIRLAEGGGLCAICGRVSFRFEHIDFCIGCRRSTIECKCFDPVFGRGWAPRGSKAPDRGHAPGPRPLPLLHGFEALRAHAAAGTLDYVTQLIGATPVARRLAGA
jgi:hypothetical protein